MSNIKILTNTKGGPCCSWSIDPSIGCSNKCLGCYAARVSYKKDFFTNIEYREWNEKEFINSCRNAKRKGAKHIRVGKLCDPFLGEQNIANTKTIIKSLTEEGLVGIFVSKSIEYDKEIAKLLKDGNHILHISLGMISEAPDEAKRKEVASKYFKCGVNIKARITADITKWNTKYGLFQNDHIIITPMRFVSREVAEQYGADISKYKWENGYYRPQEINMMWKRYTNWCGEVGSELKCANCGVKINEN